MNTKSSFIICRDGTTRASRFVQLSSHFNSKTLSWLNVPYVTGYIAFLNICVSRFDISFSQLCRCVLQSIFNYKFMIVIVCSWRLLASQQREGTWCLPKCVLIEGVAFVHTWYLSILVHHRIISACNQGCISCGILVSGIGARGVSSEHMENMEMFSCSPT